MSLTTPQLFEGRPSLKHLSLWNPEGTFQDPIALAQGYRRYAAQWYGLPTLFDPIAIQSHRVIDGGDPIVMELSNKYTVKGIGKDQIVNSIVRIHLGADDRIDKVEDRWNNKLPEGTVSEVGFMSHTPPVWAARSWSVSPPWPKFGHQQVPPFGR